MNFDRPESTTRVADGRALDRVPLSIDHKDIADHRVRYLRDLSLQREPTLYDARLGELRDLIASFWDHAHSYRRGKPLR